MQKIFFLLLLLLCVVGLQALPPGNKGTLEAKRNAVSGNYNFWLYTPQRSTEPNMKKPLIIFLHGASLCGNNMERVRRYGVLNAIERGTDVDAVVMAPQNSGGSWNPKKLNELLEWAKKHCSIDANRVYVLGMSLGGYGTMDFVGTYPQKIAAAMALCGGTTLKDLSGLGKLPLWIIHGTADRDVNISASKSVVQALKKKGLDKMLQHDWVKGWNHGRPVRMFYLKKTYDWLFAHSLKDSPRKLNKTFAIKP